MPLTDEQSDKIKEQLLKQVEHFPEDKRETIREQIESMTPEQIETFVKENGLNNEDECIFCMITEGKIPSYKIAENDSCIAILEINPQSKGHTLIVPKNHNENISQDTKKFAELVAKRLNEIFSPNEIQISQKKITGHKILEIKPDYGGLNERKRATEEELKKIQNEIIAIKRKEEGSTKPNNTEEKNLPKVRQRIP